MGTVVGTREDWLKARLALLEDEKLLQRSRDALAKKRRALPLVRIEDDYLFDTEDGRKSLQDLFGGCSQLIIYHFMYGPDWAAGCPSCSLWADGFDRAPAHLKARDTGFAAVARAPIETLTAFRTRLGWSFPFVSSLNNSFNRDFAVSFDPAAIAAGETVYNFKKTSRIGPEMPGISSFKLGGNGAIYHHYSSYARGLDPINPVYQMLDLCPDGRNEDGLDFSMSWVRRRDEYPA